MWVVSDRFEDKVLEGNSPLTNRVVEPSFESFLAVAVPHLQQILFVIKVLAKVRKHFHQNRLELHQFIVGTSFNYFVQFLQVYVIGAVLQELGSCSVFL